MEKDIVLRDVEFWVGFADGLFRENIDFRIISVDFNHQNINFEVEMALRNYDVSEDLDPTGEDYITVDGKLRFKKSLTIKDVFREVHRGESKIEFFIDEEVELENVTLSGKRGDVTQQDVNAISKCIERELIENEEYILSTHFHS